MLTSIHIQGFKGFRDTKIPELRRVNLVVGGQNSGKTSLLEAVYLGYVNDETQLADSEWHVLTKSSWERSFEDQVAQLAFRNTVKVRELEWIPTKGLGARPSIELNSGGLGESIAQFPNLPFLEAELVRLYDVAVHGKTKKKWIELLNLIEPRLESLESVAPNGEKKPCVHADLKDLNKLIPLSQLGQGFNRLAYLYAGLLGQNANIALIDEIENGIHYSALPILWQGIANIARELDIQIFATTHSKECIHAASDAFKDSPDDFQVIRLVRKDDNIEADIIPGDAVDALLACDGELR